MDNSAAAAEVLEAIGASALELAAGLRRAADPAPAGTDPLPGHTDPLQEQADTFLDGLAQAAGMEARLAAVKVNLAAGFAAAEAAMAAPAESASMRAAREMSVTASVACALTVSEGAAGRFLAESAKLSTDLPLTLAAMQAGTVSWLHGRIMCDETEGLAPVAAAAFEAHFLDPDAPGFARGCFAGELAPGRFRAKARYWRERHHRESIEKRHAKSVKDRRLEYAPDRDGMAWISAFLPADQAAGIWNRTTAMARGLQGPTETRTLTQLRADVFATCQLPPAPWAKGGAAAAGFGSGGSVPEVSVPGGSVPGGSGLAGDVPAGEAQPGDVLAGEAQPGDVPAGDVLAGEAQPGDEPSPSAQVLVTVPVFSLLGLTGEPAMLDGYGPIPASMARRLVANGATSFLRVLIDPRDGAPLEIGRTSYRLTKPMRQWIRLRDAKCTFPNCNNHSIDNDADHILAWADGGGTGVTNLGQPCPKHHRLKHATAWQPTGATRENPPGWISPTGRFYAAEHQDWEPPTLPDNFKPGWSDEPPSQDSPELPPSHALPEPVPPGSDSLGLPSGQEVPEPPEWFDAPASQDGPELPPGALPELPPGDAFPEPFEWLEPSDWPDLPDRLDAPACSEALAGVECLAAYDSCGHPGPSDDLDWVERPAPRDHFEAPLSVDPRPPCSSSTAA